MKKHASLFLTVLLTAIGFISFSNQNIANASTGTTYEVGPGLAYVNIGDVPWESLMPGDTVRIHWRAEPYKEKFIISRMGTADAPITVKGVPGPNGELPVIDGKDAATRPALNYWNDNRSVIKIGGARFEGSASDPASGNIPKYITLENLDVTNGKQSYKYTDWAGQQKSYSQNASAIYVEYGEHITIRHCIIRDSSNGLFVASGDEAQSRDILVDGNDIHGNGNVGRVFEHNVYTAAVGITFQYNHLGELCDGCKGNNLKDRSAGLVVRYNWIEGGNRQLDLVEGEDSAVIRNDPKYHETYVYGNVLISPDDDRNPQMIHYGGDDGVIYDEDWNVIGEDPSSYRKGTLYLYNNTLVSYRSGSTTVVRLSSSGEHADIRNNIIYKAVPESKLAIIDHSGTADLSHNWISAGWQGLASDTETEYTSLYPPGTVNDDGTQITGHLKFVDETGKDFRLLPGSAAVDAGTSLHPDALPANDVIREYVKHQSGEARPQDGRVDIGAYELPAGKELGEYMKQMNEGQHQ